MKHANKFGMSSKEAIFIGFKIEIDVIKETMRDVYMDNNGELEERIKNSVEEWSDVLENYGERALGVGVGDIKEIMK